MVGFETARFTVTYVRMVWWLLRCRALGGRQQQATDTYIEVVCCTRKISRLSLLFNVQSRNCDGGVQELTAAAKCIRDIFPDSKIVPVRTNAYPLKVVIEVESPEEGKRVTVWSGKQQNLFEINKNKRSKCMQRIKSKLTGLRAQPSGVEVM